MNDLEQLAAASYQPPPRRRPTSTSRPAPSASPFTYGFAIGCGAAIPIILAILLGTWFSYQLAKHELRRDIEQAAQQIDAATVRTR